MWCLVDAKRRLTKQLNANQASKAQLTLTCSKTTIKTIENTNQWRRSGVFINFERIVDFEQVNESWELFFYSLRYNALSAVIKEYAKIEWIEKEARKFYEIKVFSSTFIA